MVKVNARVYSSPTKITRVITVVSSALYFVTLVMQLSKKTLYPTCSNNYISYDSVDIKGNDYILLYTSKFYRRYI